jgi:hypothetical protein
LTQHYPKTKKYLSLFPPDARQKSSESNPTLSKANAAQTDVLRDEVRQWIRERMKKGELHLEPELHLDAKERGGNKVTEMELDVTRDPETVKVLKRKEVNSSKSNIRAGGAGVQADAFFGDDSSTSEDQESADEDEDD